MFSLSNRPVILKDALKAHQGFMDQPSCVLTATWRAFAWTPASLVCIVLTLYGEQRTRSTHYSRMVCLRSARSIMELGNAIMATSRDLIAFKVWAINHHMYVATVILVMDYCFNRNEPRAKEREEEILECFETLKKNNGGRTTTPGLQKLEKILRDATGGTENETTAYPTRWGAPAIGAPMDSSHQQNALPSKPIERRAENSSHSVISVYEHATSVPGYIFNDATSQQPWPDFDFNLLENTNLDGYLDTSLFDELFQNLDINNDLI